MAAMSLECMIRSANVDLFDAQFVAPSGVVAMLTPRLSPFVVTVHRWDILEFPYRWPMSRILTVATLKRAKGIIAVGRPIFRELTKFVSDSKIEIIPNAVDTDRFSSNLDSHHMKEMLGIPNNGRVILSVGHLIPRKGFQYLIQAMQIVRAKVDACYLVIAGGGPLRTQLAGMSRILGLDSVLRLPGVVSWSDLPLLYAMADLFVMPSLSEGHCVSILEAMASGKPVVASALDANSESIAQGENGFMVPPRNPQALARAIIKILTDDSLRRKLRWEARNRAVNEFSWKIRTERLKNYYDSVRV
jgi:glycosyltransferase involved in cell wall biosynthesis